MEIICERKDETVYEINPVIYVFQQTTRRTSSIATNSENKMLAKIKEKRMTRECSKAVENSCCASEELIIMKANHRVHCAPAIVCACERLRSK